MEQITFQLETITPMFMSGADQGKFELRPPSIKGLLRFWWRAYYWGTYVIPPNGQKTSEDIEKEMAKREGEIFGIASDNGQKSNFSIRMKEEKLLRSTKKFSGTHGFLLNYLSYGTEDKNNNREKREYILPGSTFNVILSMPNENVNEDVIKSVYLLSIFGAIGSKSRNGFGNFAIKKIFENSQENSRLFQRHIPFLFPDTRFLDTLTVNRNLPGFSAFSRGIKVFKLKQAKRSSELCHVALGEIYKECKGQMDESLFCSKRQYIASPITIQKKVRGEWQEFDHSFSERHAKPYFLRVVKKAVTEYDGYILYLPSIYCEGIDNAKEHDDNFQKYCKELNDYFLETGEMEVYYEHK